MTAHLPLRAYNRLDLSDRDESLVRAASVWEPHKGTLLCGQFRLVWNQLNLTRSAIGAFEFGSTSVIEAEPQAPVWRVGIPISGDMIHVIGRREFHACQSRAVVNKARAPLSLRITPSRTLFAGFEEAAINAALDARLGPPRREDQLSMEFPVDRGPGAAFNSYLRWLIGECDSPQPNLLMSLQSLAAIDSVLLELFVDAVAARALESFDSRNSYIGEFRMGQLIEWIDGHLGEPLSLTRLAQAAQTNLRAIQLAFRRSRAVSAREYILGRRLEAARRMLEAADESTTVTSVCVACGLYHFGRFSAHYRTKYGELPSETLARHRGDPTN